MLLTDRKDINQKRLIYMPTIFHMKIDFIWFDSQYNFPKPPFFWGGAIRLYIASLKRFLTRYVV